jgi:hypothetical protein
MQRLAADNATGTRRGFTSGAVSDRDARMQPGSSASEIGKRQLQEGTQIPLRGFNAQR